MKAHLSENCVALLGSIHPAAKYLYVILRSSADGGMTKNLEILRSAQDDITETAERGLWP